MTDRMIFEAGGISVELTKDGSYRVESDRDGVALIPNWVSQAALLSIAIHELDAENARDEDGIFENETVDRAYEALDTALNAVMLIKGKQDAK